LEQLWALASLLLASFILGPAAWFDVVDTILAHRPPAKMGTRWCEEGKRYGYGEVPTASVMKRRKFRAAFTRWFPYTLT